MIPSHPLADIFPLIEGPEFAELVTDIKANGLREKIVLHEGKILDGRNRYRAAVAAGLIGEEEQPHYEDDAGEPIGLKRMFAKFVPQLDGDPLRFVVSKNLARRHLTDSQRASVAAKIAGFSRGRPGKENPPIGGISAGQAAATLNVAPRQVERARIVHERGVPELRDALDRGEVAVSKAEQIARMPEAAQREQVQRVLPNGHRAIMGSRQEPDDGLDYFPTPPWATRALIEVVLRGTGHAASLHAQSAWEPACGEGHMAEVLREYFGAVFASDVHGHGYGDVIDFLADDAADRAGVTALGGEGDDPYDWIITNPPFGEQAEAFVLRALERARVGVAMFLRLQWLESVGRYERIFAPHPPAIIAPFAERVPLHKGRWEPEGTTATAYVWNVWLRARAQAFTRTTAFVWIPPGQRERLTRADDVARFTQHPVARAARTLRVADDGSATDPETGEIIEAEAEADPTDMAASAGPADVRAACAGAVRPLDDDALEIPAFLRRNRDNTLAGETP